MKFSERELTEQQQMESYRKQQPRREVTMDKYDRAFAEQEQVGRFNGSSGDSKDQHKT